KLIGKSARSPGCTWIGRARILSGTRVLCRTGISRRTRISGARVFGSAGIPGSAWVSRARIGD
ncbi:MAG: hypothetical protein O6837_04470, partial [Deltaproteobacteria bacterium]|nr:hypothetical protein [Deltaproteobacteria bacterium]